MTALALWGALLIGALYMLRAVRNILHGPLPEKWNSIPDASNVWRKLPYALLLASLFVFGIWPRLLTEKITPDAQKIVAMAMVAQRPGCHRASAPTTLAGRRRCGRERSLTNPQSATRN